MGRFTRPHGPDLSDGARVVAYSTAVFFTAAGVLHVSAAADHTNLPVMLAGFIVVATLQVGFAGILLWRRPDPVLLVGATALTVLAVGIWVVSRTRGLPFMEGGHMEPIGFKDAVAVLFELACLPGLLLLGSRELSEVRLPSVRLGSSTVAGLAAGVFALSVPALVLGGGAHHSGTDHAADAHSHGDGERAGGEAVDGAELASSQKGTHHSSRRERARAGDEGGGERSHGHLSRRAGGGAGPGHSDGQGGHTGGDTSAGNGLPGGHSGDDGHRTRGGEGGQGGGERRGHGKGGHGKTGRRGEAKGKRKAGHGKGGHGKGGHGETPPDHGGHAGDPAGSPELLPPGEPLQRLCNEGGVCIP